MVRGLALARQSGRDAKARQPDRAGRGVNDNVGRFNVPVNEASIVDIAQIRDDTDGETQEASHLHWRAEHPLERLTTGVVKHQHGPTMLAHQLQRSHRPRTVQIIPEFVFASEAI